MAKVKTVWYCTSCGNEYAKWMGQCPACGEWNTMVEEPKAASSAKAASPARTRPYVATEKDAKPQPLSQIDMSEESRFSIGIEEVDRLLGGGMVRGSMILIGGEPGIGKSTLILQSALNINKKVLYISGEESDTQIRLRAERIGINNPDCLIYTEIDIDKMKGDVIVTTRTSYEDGEDGGCYYRLEMIRKH